MIDSGSDVNLIKQSFVKVSTVINAKDTLSLQGIAPEPIVTLGSISIFLLGRFTEFHIIPDDLVVFPQDGILGTAFFELHKAVIDYKNKRVRCENLSIPFKEKITITVKPRSVTPFYVIIANPELMLGYFPRFEIEDGVYLGDAVVTNRDGKAHLPIFNTTNKEYELQVPIIELEEFTLSDTQDEAYRGQADPCGATAALGSVEADGPLDSLSSSSSGSDFYHTNTLDTRADADLGMANARGADETRGHESAYGPPENTYTPTVVRSCTRDPIYSHTITHPDTQTPVDLGYSVGYDNVKTRGHATDSGPLNTQTFDRVETILNSLRLEHLNSEERISVRRLVNDHADRFHLPHDRLDITNAAQHFIPTINNVPVHMKQYRFPPIHRDEVETQVSELLRNDIIEHSNSPYNSPLWIVPKKSDSAGNKRWRMVIDYRLLNEKTIGDAYPLPNITDILDQLGSAKYFSVLDLASGFHQIPMAPEDAPKTAFSTPYGHYQFKRMPFGLKNAPATFQRLMDNVLSGLQGNELFVYMDDIVIYAHSLHEHEIKFKRLMKRLEAANLKLQPDKCEFLRHEVGYLGHIISSNGVRPDPNKIRAIQNFPSPRTQKNIKQFLGLAGYYRRFIPNFSKIAKPLTDLLKKDKKFLWQQSQIEAFNILRNSLCSEPILQYPDFTKPFNLTTDASGYAIGGVLSQGRVSQDLPIAYTSRTLNSAELKYSTIEKECLSIVYCTNYFRPYLYGRKFIIITDHKPLVWLNSIKDPSSRLWKWRTKLAEYEYEIHYKKGKLNSNADALSRNPPSTKEINNEELNTTEKSLCYPLIVNESSDESLFSVPTTSRKASDSINRNLEERFEDEVVLNSNDPIEEIEEDVTNDTDDSSVDDSIFQQDSVPADIEPTTKQSQSSIDIKETRETLLARKDNHVIFIELNGLPFDHGAKEYHYNNLLPVYSDLLLERARVTTICHHKKLIALPIKANERTCVDSNNVKNCIKSLVDVINELELTSFSIRKTNHFDDIPWNYIKKQLTKHLDELSVNITICKGLISTPTVEQRKQLIAENHTSATGGHKGVTKTYNRTRINHYWNTMKRDIENFIRNCRKCQLKKLTRVKTRQPMIITDTPGQAFDKISMDIMGPLPMSPRGNTHILTIQDLLTKYSVVIPLKETTSLAIADAFTKNFICIYGAPKAILTDQGQNFLSSLMKNLARKFKIQQYKTTAYHPQSNGSIERSHHVLTEYLKTQIDKETNWDEHLSLAMFSYNTSIHESTNYSPFELVYGRVPRLPSAHEHIEENLEPTYQEYLIDLFNKIRDSQEEARKNLINSKERSKRYYDRKLNVQAFKEGDLVFLLKEPCKGKFADQYTGPHEILEILPNNNAKIQYKNATRVVHFNKLKIVPFDPG